MSSESIYSLRDVMCLVHPKPKDKQQAELWGRLLSNELKTPDTWEVAISDKSKNPKVEFERLLTENKMGALAVLRNLRQMTDKGVDPKMIRAAILRMKTEKILPYQFITAARFAPQYEPELEEAMLKCLNGLRRLPGKTILLIDVSGSMDQVMTSNQRKNYNFKNERVPRPEERKRLDVSSGLAILARELCEEIDVFTFSERTVAVPPRRGFALRDVITQSQPHSQTYLMRSCEDLVRHYSSKEKADRIIVLTDEQSQDGISQLPPAKRGYLINVAPYKFGVGYGIWHHIDGFSEHVFSYIQDHEEFKKALDTNFLNG